MGRAARARMSPEQRAVRVAATRDWRARQKRDASEAHVLRAADAVVKMAAWRKANPARARQQASVDHKRRQAARDQEAMPLLAAVRADPCAYCGGAAATLDHIVPVSRGGANGWENLTAACKPCNSSKGAESLLLTLLRWG